MNTPDLRIAGYAPAGPPTAQALASLTTGDRRTVIDHHTDTASYLLLYDTTATWDDPKPQVRTVAVHRSPQNRTFTLDTATHTTFAFAQRWLADRGAALDAISVTGNPHARPADAASEQVEDKIRASGTRYELLQVFHEDLDDTCDAWTLVRDRTAQHAPTRAFLQQGDLEERTYTLREGAFPDEDTALAWLADRTTPLPAVPRQPPTHRTTAVRSRSALPHNAAPTTQPVPSPSAQPPNPGRSR